MDRRVINRKDVIQTFSDKNFNAFSEQDLHEISTDFNYMFKSLQMVKNEQFSVFEFPEFIYCLQDNDFSAAQMFVEGALREYKLGRGPRTQLKSNMSSTSRYRSPNEAAPDEKETTQRDGNEIDCKEDLTRISSSGRTVPNSAVKVHTPGSVTANTSIQHFYDSYPQTSPETVKNNKPADETNTSRDFLRRREETSLLLRQGNQNIAVLSDPNRPTKLAERFSELYSNEYTDAFEFLQEQGHAEEHIVYDLLRIVRYVYNYCRQRTSDELTKRIYNVLQERMPSKEFTVDDKEDKMVKGLAAKKLKMDAPCLKMAVCESFAQKEFWNLIPKEIDPQNEKLVTYVWNCVNIVWLMCVQDPPISMSWVEKGDIFDTSRYRAYTKHGTIVDFCVWPLVLLADSGPLLTK
ncbi:hypothetical protein ACJMK2_031142 [Sinanodonta woodiana]|uniref:Mitochondria-eating protein C-terminal domain-containing protein n=1 Tax=Sinanodonta woodiana TaxID=1069815 RepID=A0ABD3WXW8_SINWO